MHSIHPLSMSGLKAIIIAFAVFVAACGHDDHDHDNNENHGSMTPEEEACLHANDPFEAISASSTPGGDLPDINATHTHYRISLVPVGGESDEYYGHIAFAPDRDGDFAIFTSVALPIEIVDEDDSPVTLTTSAVDLCVEIAQMHVAHFHDEGHVITFGPTTEPELSVIVEFAGGGHDGHDGHDH